MGGRHLVSWLWLAVGLLGLLLGISGFGLVGWWLIGRAESRLDDGDPNNPYHHDKGVSDDE